MTKDLKTRSREVPEGEREEKRAAKSNEDESKDGSADIGELGTNIEEDVWEERGEYEAEGGGGSRIMEVSTPRP